MTDTVTAFPDERRIAGEDWSLRAERVEVLGGAWRALIGVRRGLKLLVSGTDLGHEVEVEAWAGEPEESDGVAVIDAGDGVPGWPGCRCADAGTVAVAMPGCSSASGWPVASCPRWSAC
jgi:hypothetical protein